MLKGINVYARAVYVGKVRCANPELRPHVRISETAVSEASSIDLQRVTPNMSGSTVLLPSSSEVIPQVAAASVNATSRLPTPSRRTATASNALGPGSQSNIQTADDKAKRRKTDRPDSRFMVCPIVGCGARRHNDLTCAYAQFCFQQKQFDRMHPEKVKRLGDETEREALYRAYCAKEHINV